MEKNDQNQLNNRIRDLINRCETSWKNGKLDEAQKLAQEALQLANQDPTNIFAHGDAIHNLGIIFSKKKQFAKAETFLKRALDLWKQGGTRKDILNTLIDLGDVYSKAGKIFQAKNSFQEALVLSERLMIPETTAGILINLGVTNWQHGEYYEAEKHYQQSIAIYEEFGDQTMIFFVRNNLAALYRECGEYDSAKKLLEQNLTQIEQQGEQYTNEGYRMVLAKLQLELDALKKAGLNEKQQSNKKNHNHPT